MLEDIFKTSVKKIDWNNDEYLSTLRNVTQEFKAQIQGSDEDFRPFQASAVAKTIHYLNNGFKRILIVKPTGVGKTIISRNLFSSNEIRKSLKIESDRPLRLLFIANKKRLLQQAERTYHKAENIEIITISTCLKTFPLDLLEEGWDITCLDEAHHESMTSFQLYLESITDAPLVGLTATPFRPDNCILKFEATVNEINRKDAVEQGYIAESEVISIMNFSKKDNIEFLKRVICDFYSKMGQTILALKTKKEVLELGKFLGEMGGISYVAIIDQTGDELNQILDDFSDGKYQILLNCNKINEGVDVKNCNTIGLFRSYNSVIELNQTIGRAARPDSGCRIIELINPLSKNLNALSIVDETINHELCYYRGNTLKTYNYKTKELLHEKESLFVDL